MFGAVISLAIGTATYLALSLVIDGTVPRERHALGWRIRFAVLALASTLLNGVLSYYATAALQSVGVRPLFRHINLGQFALGLVALLLIHDFLNYWAHRALHRFLWRFHAVHHSPRELTSAAATFVHPVEEVFRAISLGTVAGLIGFSGAVPFAVTVAIRLQEFYIHSPTSMHFGPLGQVLIDNRAHRVHHSRDQKDYDQNFGVLFTLWDRIFGTYSRPSTWSKVGLKDVDQPRNLWQALTLPWRLDRLVNDLPTTPGGARVQHGEIG